MHVGHPQEKLTFTIKMKIRRPAKGSNHKFSCVDLKFYLKKVKPLSGMWKQ